MCRSQRNRKLDEALAFDFAVSTVSAAFFSTSAQHEHAEGGGALDVDGLGVFASMVRKDAENESLSCSALEADNRDTCKSAFGAGLFGIGVFPLSGSRGIVTDTRLEWREETAELDPEDDAPYMAVGLHYLNGEDPKPLRGHFAFAADGSSIADPEDWGPAKDIDGTFGWHVFIFKVGYATGEGEDREDADFRDSFDPLPSGRVNRDYQVWGVNFDLAVALGGGEWSADPEEPAYGTSAQFEAIYRRAIGHTRLEWYAGL